MSLCISTNLQVETASPVGEDLPRNFVGAGHKEGADAVGRSRAASERERAEDEDVLAERELDEARVGTGFTNAGERVSDREEFSNAAQLTPAQFAHRASASDGGAHATYAANDRPLYEEGGHFTYDKKKDVFKFAYYGQVSTGHGTHASDEVEYLYKPHAPKDDQYKLWKKSCGDNCPGFYKVFMNCLGHYGMGGMGPHCYLQFWCTKSNTDDTYHDC